MKNIIKTSVFSLSVVFSVTALADVITLTDGQTLTGKLVSQDAKGVVFEIAGQQLTFDSAKVKGISFGEAKAASTPQDSITSPAIDNSPNAATANAGSRLVVKTNAAINSNKHSAGHKFTARLEADLMNGGVVIAPKGSTLYGVVQAAEKSRRATGNSSVLITFTDIMLNNQLIPIKTTAVKAVTESTTKDTVNRTARLAAIGGLANGSEGARNSAKFGLGASLLTRGKAVNIPAGTLLEFELAAPLSK